MEELPLLLNILVVALWLGVLVALLRRPPDIPRGWGRITRRALWGVAALVSLAAGGWGPQLWRSTTSTSPPNPSAGPPVESVTGMVRTPFAIVERTAAVDGEGRVIRNERRTTLQLPLALLAFLTGAGWLQWRRRTSRAALAACVTLLAAGLAGACGGSELSSTDRPARRIVEARWDTLAHVKAELNDSSLYSAGRVTVDADGIWVGDVFGGRIARFDWEGRLVRYVGRRGAGPGELGDFRLMDADDLGTLWVLDAPNRRISGFDEDGSLVDEIPLGDLGWTPDAFAVTGDGQHFFLMETLEELTPVIVDRDGTMARGPALSIPEARGAWGMALQGIATRDRGGELWVYAFSSGDGFFRMSGLEVAGPRVPYPEAIPFPHLVRSVSRDGPVTSTTTQLTDRKPSAGSIWAQDGNLYVVFQGETEHAGLLLDRYDLRRGRYEDTVLLPRPGYVAVWGDRLVLSGNNPVPELLVLRRIE